MVLSKPFKMFFLVIDFSKPGVSIVLNLLYLQIFVY
jgi:hypothetical protein